MIETETYKTEDKMIYNPELTLHDYNKPMVDLLSEYNGSTLSAEEHQNQISKILGVFSDFDITLEHDDTKSGPTVTRYEFKVPTNTKLSKIKGLEDEIKFHLASQGVRIIAPIPQKAAIGVEVPNSNQSTVGLSEIIENDEFKNTDMTLPIAMGKTSVGKPFFFDLTKMPHILMAGATGQGKSVGINVMLASLLYNQHPSNLKLMLIDPKKVELPIYEKLRNHFMVKADGIDDVVISDVDKAVQALTSLTKEMDVRYDMLKDAKVKNIVEYNKKYAKGELVGNHKHLPHIVLVVDEFSDLIMTAGKDIEAPIARLAQLSRAVGIHLIVATQRPSSDVITGMIKANFPARISFRVATKVDSRTILDSSGAEALIGRGDMLFKLGIETFRVQSAFISNDEIENLVNHISNQSDYGKPYVLPKH